MPLPHRRAATASIRGYLYQTVLAALAWLDLESDETLVVEGDDDFDQILRGETVSTQVKHRADPVVSLSSRSFNNSLRAFAEIFVDSQGKSKFVYVTTQSRKPPRGEVDHVANWEKGEQLQGVAAALATVAADWDKAPSDPERWLAFVEAVTLRFDQDGVGEKRHTLAERLRRHASGISDAAALSARVLDELWHASSEDDVGLRTKTKSQLDDLIRDAERGLTDWIGTKRAQRLVGWVDAAVALESMLPRLERKLKDPNQPSQLLDARYRVIPFLQELRRDQIAEFETWFASEPDVDVRVVVGSGGTGKTRLFMELCERRRAAGWHAGFLELRAKEEDATKVGAGHGARLLVVDYAETRLAVTRALLVAVDRCTSRCRVVLLAREPGPWLQTLRTGDAVSSELMPDRPIQLEALSPQPGEQRMKAFVAMVQGFASARSVDLPDPLPAVDLDAKEMDNALMLAMAALEATRDERQESIRLEHLLSATLEHEQRFWARWLEDHGIQSVSPRQKSAVGEVVAAMTLLGSVETEEDAEQVVKRLFEARTTMPDLRIPRVVALLSDVYGDAEKGQFAAGLRPDLLGEHLVFEVLSKQKETNLWFDSVLHSGDEVGASTAFTVLGRMGFRAGDVEQRGKIEGWIRDALGNEFLTRSMSAYRAAIGLGSRTTTASVGRVLAEVLSEQEAELAQAAAESILRELHQLNPTPISLRELGVSCGQLRVATLRDDPEAAVELARALNNLGIVQSEMGAGESALVSTQEAVDIRRELARARPDTFLPHLANALNNLGAMQRNLGDREYALASTLEAIGHYRDLAQARPDAFLPDLASALNNLGIRLTELGDRESALASTLEAVGHYRKLAQARPDAFLPHLANALNNLGNQQSELGDRESALASTLEALDYLRELARARPDAFLPDLANALNNLGVTKSDLGDKESALASTLEAVDIQRELARGRPDAFLPDLARSMNNLGNRQSEMGDKESALASTLEAVDIRRELARARPGAFLPNLARSLNNLGARQSELGDRESALASTLEAVDIRRELARERPDAFLPDLALSLEMLGFVLLAAGQATEALAPLSEGLRIMMPFAEQLPEAHRQFTLLVANRLVSAAKAADVEPDADLLDQVRQIYGDDFA